MLTGLYPSDHGIHENSRYLEKEIPTVATLIEPLGYRSTAVVSAFPLARQFGLATDFGHYDDDFGSDQAERRADSTTDRALEYLASSSETPLFLWVHYYDPHDPYDPPEPFKSRYPENAYLAEIAYLDTHVGRLLEGFRKHSQTRPLKIVAVGDHGEGLGAHGEYLHGNLLSQEVMRVPLIVAGTDIEPGIIRREVSIRRVFDTILQWAGLDRPAGLLGGESEVVMAEAMKPHLQYGWQPQVMAIQNGVKVIRSGEIEVYDLDADPQETEDLAGQRQIPQTLRDGLAAYPFRPNIPAENSGAQLSDEDRKRLASLGYVDWEGQSSLRKDAPSPREMTAIFMDLDHGSRLFTQGKFEEVIPVFKNVLVHDPNNLMVALRLGAAYSLLNDNREALRYFRRAREIEPNSIDTMHYLAMHYLQTGEWSEAEPLLQGVLTSMPNRLPALEGLAQIREQQGRYEETLGLLERIIELKNEPTNALLRLGEVSMALGKTRSAIQAFERVREIQLEHFDRFLELGVCYLADRQFSAARDCLDQVGSSHPAYPMALFKRAQVSVLLEESNSGERIRQAYENADREIRQLIEREPLFRGISLQ
jgi:tetratricopeptide (TPR) repeat protein